MPARRLRRWLNISLVAGLILVLAACGAFWFGVNRPAWFPSASLSLPSNGQVMPSDITFLTTDPDVDADVTFRLVEDQDGRPRLSVYIGIRDDVDESFFWAVVGRGEWSFFGADEDCTPTDCRTEEFSSPGEAITSCTEGNWFGPNLDTPASIVIGTSDAILGEHGYIAVQGTNDIGQSGLELALPDLRLPYFPLDHRFDTTMWNLSGIGATVPMATGDVSLIDPVCLEVGEEEMPAFDFGSGTGTVLIEGDDVELAAAVPASESFPGGSWTLGSGPVDVTATMVRPAAVTTLQWVIFLAGVLAGTGAPMVVEGFRTRRAAEHTPETSRPKKKPGRSAR